MRHEIDHDRRSQDEDVVLAFADVDCVGIRQTEPLLADARHVAAAALENVLVVDEVPLGFEVVGTRDVDGEATSMSP
jgi:hypothetical protein